MRIALVIGALSFGGAERVMVNLANYLVHENDVLLLTMFERESPYPLDSRVAMAQGLAEGGKLKSLVRLRKAVVGYGADVALSFLTQINISTIIALQGTKIPVVVSERNDPAFEPAQLYRRILRRIVFPLAQGFVFQTQEAKNRFSRSIQKRSAVIPNPVFVDDSAEAFSDRNGEFVAIGRLTSQKNYSMMIDAFSAVSKKKQDLVLRIYGDGELKARLQQEIRARHAEKNIFLMGTSADIHHDIKKSLGFLLSSDHEGMPNALLEAMALGLCCISTDCPCGGPREIIEDGVSGILAPAGDKKAFSEAIEKVISDHDFARSLSERARAVRENYSLSVVGDRWQQYLQQIAKV